MQDYDNPWHGHSLGDFWAAAIPRLFWPDKPMITRLGAEYEQCWMTADATSALAPTCSAEAYWNHGWPRVFVVGVGLSPAPRTA